MVARFFSAPSPVWLIGIGMLAVAAALYPSLGITGAAGPLVAAAVILGLALGTGPIADWSASSPISLRWKIPGAIFLILSILLAVAFANFATIQFTHEQIHQVQIFRDSSFRPQITQGIQSTQGPSPELIRQMQTRADRMDSAVATLEETQHGILSWTPGLIFAGGFVALALGAALSTSLVRPLKKMSEATRFLAAGEFSTALDVPNRDELGELASSINSAAEDLSRHQEALVEAERAIMLDERLAFVTQAQEEERRRLSREIHDGLGPSLAALGHRLYVIRGSIRSDPTKAESGLDDVISSLREHVRMTRELINDLRPLDLDQLGLAGALTQHVERFGREADIQVSLSLSSTTPTGPLTEITLYRVLQESLTNIRKHAGARVVNVSMRDSGDGVELEVVDDGVGFNASEISAAPRDGLGLINMRERGEAIGGTFSIDSDIGKGCRLQIWLPNNGA